VPSAKADVDVRFASVFIYATVSAAACRGDLPHVGKRNADVPVGSLKPVTEADIGIPTTGPPFSPNSTAHFPNSPTGQRTAAASDAICSVTVQSVFFNDGVMNHDIVYRLIAG
jgi:hypothetical protein